MNKTNYRNGKKNNGFTLVELVVVIVIIAVLAAIIVPAFISYMDKQKREQVMVNAKNCLMDSQSLSSEKYIYGQPLFTSLDALNQDVGKASGMDLTSASKTGAITYVKFGSKGKDLYTVHEFRYTENGITAVWKLEEAKWKYSDEEDIAELTGLYSGGDGNSSGIVNNDIVIPNSEKIKKDSNTNDNPVKDEQSTSEDESVTEEPATTETIPTTEKLPVTEEPATTETIVVEEPTTTEEPTTETNTSTDNKASDNNPGGELIVKYGETDIATGEYIKTDDYWPDGELISQAIADAISQGDWSLQNETLSLKKGDVFVYKNVLYYVVTDRDLPYGNAKDGADNIFKWGWDLV
ncbi:MAG: prepilin-type N-terminal cleavage/methylation domain-containing protein, partial [Lachnospiraceae bacterium]|nr:prepilin-type N-terminal cleavage/methylation domain-containing protein [Lachnospiraceae bacterium]